jgi:hypothetical protein
VWTICRCQWTLRLGQVSWRTIREMDMMHIILEWSFGGPQNLPSAANSHFSASGDVARWGCFQCVLMYHVEQVDC